MDRAAQANKKTLALLVKPDRPTPSNTFSARSSHNDTESGIKSWGTARFCRGRHISAPMCDQSTECNPHWHIIKA